MLFACGKAKEEEAGKKGEKKAKNMENKDTKSISGRLLVVRNIKRRKKSAKFLVLNQDFCKRVCPSVRPSVTLLLGGQRRRERLMVVFTHLFYL